MDKLKQRAELALLISLPVTVKGIVKPGRLKNLVQKIADEAEREYNNRFKQASQSEILKIGKCLNNFNERVKWSKRPRHILSYISAISVFIEGRKYDKINKLILETIDYFERAGKAPQACFWPGVEAEKIWAECFK